MDESELEGTLILERLAEINKVDEFFEAVDSDNIERLKKLMELIDTDQETIQLILKKIEDLS